MRTRYSTLFVCLAVFLAAAASLQAQDPVDKLQDLVGARGAAVDRLPELGYTYVRTSKSTDTSYSYWIEEGTNRCVVAGVRDGKVASIVYSDGDCQEPAAKPLEPGGFETVCGVITGNKSYRYRCQAIDEVSADGEKKTTLRYPDMEMTLHWGEGNNVEIERAGLKSVQATFSTHEGQTDIFSDERTYFYVSNREAAKLEVQHLEGDGGLATPSSPAPDFADGLSGGPDFWSAEVGSTGSLGVHFGPGESHEVALRIGDGTVVRNLGCKISDGSRWCRIGLLDGTDTEGWVEGRFLREAAAPGGGGGTAISGDPEQGIPDLFVRSSGEIEVNWKSGCSALYSGIGSLITAGSSCSTEQRRMSDEAVAAYRREQ